MTSRLESVIFKMPNKVLIEETNKNFGKYCSDFLDLAKFNPYCQRRPDFGTFLG